MLDKSLCFIPTKPKSTLLFTLSGARKINGIESSGWTCYFKEPYARLKPDVILKKTAVHFHSDAKMFCKSASQLVKELTYNNSDQLTPFNHDTFEQVIKECNEHHLQLQSLMRKIQDDGLDIQTTRNADHFGAVIHHLSLIRNKRCLMAYMFNRAEVIQGLRWKIGPVLPEEIQGKLNHSEEEYFKNHAAALETYMSEIDLDLAVDMIPPKDPSIQVRVLCDIGDVLLGDQIASLVKNSVHLMKRTDAEQFISQGMMEEFN